MLVLRTNCLLLIGMKYSITAIDVQTYIARQIFSGKGISVSSATFEISFSFVYTYPK